MASNKNNVEMNKLFTKLVDSALTMTEMLDPKDQADVYIRLAQVVASTGIVTDLVKEKDIAVDDESSPIISSTGTKGSEDKSDKEETIIIDEKPAKTDAVCITSLNSFLFTAMLFIMFYLLKLKFTCGCHIRLVQTLLSSNCCGRFYRTCQSENLCQTRSLPAKSFSATLTIESSSDLSPILKSRVSC